MLGNYVSVLVGRTMQAATFGRYSTAVGGKLLDLDAFVTSQQSCHF